MSLQASDKISSGAKNFNGEKIFTLACRVRAEDAVSRLLKNFLRLARSPA